MKFDVVAFVAILVGLTSMPAFASKEGDLVHLRNCISNWGKTPFNTDHLEYRTIKSKVRILGIGGEVKDTRKTNKPELILVKPNVSVLSKATLRLLNPNGWYCLKGEVAVLGKSEVQLACKANLTSSGQGETVMGSNNHEDNGVAILGSAKVRRVGSCVPGYNAKDDVADDEEDD